MSAKKFQKIAPYPDVFQATKTSQKSILIPEIDKKIIPYFYLEKGSESKPKIPCREPNGMLYK